MITREYADRYITKPKGRVSKIKDNYNTDDIISEILESDKKAWRDVSEFAKHLKFSNLNDLCNQLYDFLINNISYKEDDFGSQLTKFPAIVWNEKKGDCKKFSLFIGGVMKVLKIPYSYRFVSYSGVPVYTHVYVIVHGKSRDIIMDMVYKRYNEEKEFTFYKDYYMKGLYRIEGINGPSLDGIGAMQLQFKNHKNEPTNFVLYKKVEDMTDGDMDLAIARQRLEIEKDIVAGIRGIGSAKVAEYQKSIDVINAFIAASIAGDIAGMENIINGIGGDSVGVGFLKKVFKKIKKAAKALAKFTKKVTLLPLKIAVKVAKGVVKVVTFPLRLIAKGILEITLPKSASFFLYLFINKPEILAKMPQAVKNKRKKQVKIADFIVNGIGMKREHFMGILRNSLMKQYKMSPEKKLSQMFGMEVSGIGIITEIISAVIKIIKLLSGGKKKANITSNDAPDPADFKSLVKSASTKLLQKEILTQPTAVEPGGESLQPGQNIPSDGGAKKVSTIC